MSTWSGTSITGDGVMMVTGPAPAPLPEGSIYPNSIGDEACDDFGPLRDRYGDPEATLCTYLHALGSMLKQTDDLAKDGPNGEPGWSQIFDLNRAKTEWLPWTGQLVGYQVPVQPNNQSLEEYDQIQRERILTRSAHRRATVARMADEIKDHLGGSQRVIIRERYNGDPWTIKVWVYEAEIRTSEAEVTKAALSQKLAGLLMEFSILPPTGDYDALRASNADYAEVLADHPDYESVILDPFL